jgi:putative heme transporter
MDPSIEQRNDTDDPEPYLATGELPALPPDPSRPIPRRRPVRFSLRIVVFAVVVYFLILPQIPGFRQAATDLSRVQPVLLLVGFVLVMASIMCYSGLTKAALGDAGADITQWHMFRIQLSTRALANVVPGGSAAGSALGYRLLTLSGVRGPDAGFALATAGLGSAIVLNLIFWVGLLISIPIRGVNALYVLGAIAGILIMTVAALLVIGLLDGNGRSERAIRWTARTFHLNEDRWANVLRELGARVEDLIKDRSLLKRVVGWSAAQWAFDMAALWVFIRAFGQSVDLDALIVVFGLANILAAIPITPGGLGIVEGVYIATLVGFGLPRRTATLGVASYRIAQYFFPIVLGGLMYLSLRMGPWSIKRRERLLRLRELAEADPTESRLDFALRFTRKQPAEPPLPGDSTGESTGESDER